MPFPSDRETRICGMFDSFCKKVSCNFLRNLERAESNRTKHYSDEPVEYLLEFIGCADEYPSDSLYLDLDGYSCMVESEILFEALLALKVKERQVLFYSFWREFTDVEISKEMEVTARTVYNLRQRAYSKIREFYERRGRDS